MIEKTLQKLGLSEKEVKVYLTLLGLGNVPASIIAKRAGIERTHTIYICKSLVKKRILTYIEKNGTFIFTAIPPRNLFDLIEEESRIVEDKKVSLNRVMGDLQNMVNPNISLPKVQFFEGVDGMINIYKDMLKEGKDIYDCNSVDRSFMHPDVVDYWAGEYMSKREKMTNKSFSLYNGKIGFNEYTSYDEKVRRVTLYIEEENFPFESQMMIYGKKVAFCSLHRDDLTGVIIENEAIYKTQFSLFRLSWNYARTLQKNMKYKDVSLPTEG